MEWIKSLGVISPWFPITQVESSTDERRQRCRYLDTFFDELGKERSEAIEAMSMGLGPVCKASAKKEGHGTKAINCCDPLHVVQLATHALEKLVKEIWQKLRQLEDQDTAKRFKEARWALL